MKYLEAGPMSFGYGSKQYRDNWERTFRAEKTDEEAGQKDQLLCECTECDECDGSGVYYIDGEPQPCICSEPQDSGEGGFRIEEEAGDPDGPDDVQGSSGGSEGAPDGNRSGR